MTIRQQGGVFGRNPVFNDLSANSASFTALTAGTSSLGAITGTSFNIAQFKTGTNILESNAAGQNGARLRAAVSSASFPTFSFTSDNNTGLYNSTADVLGVSVGGAEAGSFTSNGLAFPNGKGIDFSATAGTGTSELFDDYEEGTWTPVISDANSGGNLGSAAISDATYTKIGRTVVLSASLSNIDTTGMTSTAVLYIQGLPFTSAAATYAVGNVKVDTVTFPGSRTYIYCQIGGGNAYMNFQVGASAVSEDNLDVQHISSGVSDIQFSITYTAA